MSEITIKKLITGFLVFSAITSSSVFLFSGFLSNGNTRVAGDRQQGKNAVLLDSVHSKVKVPDNVFVEPIPRGNPIGDANIANSQDDGLPPISASANLTDRLAATIVRSVVKQNPGGPSQNEAGQLSVASPDLDATIAEAIAGKGTGAAPTGWNVHVADADIKIINNYSSNDIQNYLDSFGKIVSGGIGSSEVQNTLQRGDASPGTINALSVTFDEADIALKKLPVPAPLVNFHKNFLMLVAYEKQAVGAVNSDDPLSQMLALQNAEQNISSIFRNLENEAKKAASISGNSSSSENALLALAGLFEIKSAHAFFGVDAAITVARMVWEWVRKHIESVILQTLKNQLVNRIMQQTVNWIQGGGKPQFITNWRGFLRQTEKDAVSNAIQAKIPGLCQSLGPLIKLQLSNVYLSNPLQTCMLEQVVQNVKNFYNDFNQGGWVGYGALILPSGNYFGSLFETTQQIEAERLAKKEAAKSSAESSGGFLATKVCVKFGPSPRQSCVDSVTENADLVARETGESPNYDFSRCISLSDRPSCEEDKDTTPGQVAGDAVAGAIGAPLHNIVNAQDVVGLVSAFVNSTLNRLVLAGVRGLAELNTRDRVSGNEPPPPGEVTPQNPSEVPPGESGPGAGDLLDEVPGDFSGDYPGGSRDNINNP
ncbi:MAG: hypothetical protein HY434_02350 [Candidatus Liptonbacteria bacterium]|nr:hypothetical protein [Candidatus Liptonbacteria bacterium]